MDILYSWRGLEEAADRSFAPDLATKRPPGLLDRSTAKSATCGEAVLKLVRPPMTPELHFSHPDRSALGAGFSYGCACPAGLKRRCGAESALRRHPWPMLAHRFWRETMWQGATRFLVPGRNGHLGPRSFGFMQHSGILAEICDRSVSRAGSTENWTKWTKRATPVEDGNE